MKCACCGLEKQTCRVCGMWICRREVTEFCDTCGLRSSLAWLELPADEETPAVSVLRTRPNNPLICGLAIVGENLGDGFYWEADARSLYWHDTELGERGTASTRNEARRAAQAAMAGFQSYVASTIGEVA